MSTAAREALVARLHFTDDSQRSDLLDDTITNTYLIALLQDLVSGPEAIEILAVRSDHPTPDGPWAHSGGMAVDLYPLNWEGREETACKSVLRSLAESKYCEAIGLGGVTQAWAPPSPSSFCVVFNDNDADHIHTGCANSVDAPGVRANA